MRTSTASPTALQGFLPFPPHSHTDAYTSYTTHSSGQRVDTDIFISTTLRKEHPKHTLTILPLSYGACRLLAFANAGHAVAVPSPDTPTNSWHLSDRHGDIEKLQWFGRYSYVYSGVEYILYTVSWFLEMSSQIQEMQYLLSPAGTPASEVEKLVKEASIFYQDPDKPGLWVFDFEWKKSEELYAEVMKAEWKDVVLDPALRKRIVGDVEGFYRNKEVYKEYGIPWKRGIIFYGPPGNGKTITIKALMHSVSSFSPPTTLLYVRSLRNFYGDEHSISEIFAKARNLSPSLLVFEDLDTLITEQSRSYFLNELDGIQNNDGVCIIASTNHVEKLDPGIAKRPSRFDRKYLFPLPGARERVEYCQYWREKLNALNTEIEFPDKLCKAIADITHGFSFAYMKEAFVSTLVVLAGGTDDDEGETQLPVVRDVFNKYRLWRIIKLQIRNLREEMGESENARVDQDGMERGGDTAHGTTTRQRDRVAEADGEDGDGGDDMFALGGLLQQFKEAMEQS
ncbi:P-loop containing nucleoside triphosphate hydrolase protein [Sphaerosporella brunnea]|uniref:P-loop containing nucleoside triphosphate hydrolase protein n=1 Tax=Sphaerosporella brunnea TaxID=1250544 RepID=A0A5J5F6D3_9PEZI|nr:P-loop containing nucleoside triphosphate hydrolase protein [Sphaerosporella brunnea]